MKLSSQLYFGMQTFKAHLMGCRIPLSVYLVLNENCPNKCIYCNYHNMDISKENEMGTQEILKLIDEMREAGTQKLQLTGGEPLARKDIGEIIDKAKRNISFVGMSTSGLLLPEKIKDLKKLDILFLSLDGPREIHEYLRGKGSFDMVLRAVESLKRENIKFWITTVLNKKNINHLDYILDFAKRNKIIANFVPLYTAEKEYFEHLPTGAKVKEIILDKVELDKALTLLLQRKKERYPIGSSSHFFEYVKKWNLYPNIYSNDQIGKPHCWAGCLYCFIFSDGTISPCVQQFDSNGNNRINAAELGFNQAFLNLSKYQCKSCIIACHLEQNILFSLNVKALLNYKKLLK